MFVKYFLRDEAQGHATSLPGMDCRVQLIVNSCLECLSSICERWGAMTFLSMDSAILYDGCQCLWTCAVQIHNNILPPETPNHHSIPHFSRILLHIQYSPNSFRNSFLIDFFFGIMTAYLFLEDQYTLQKKHEPRTYLHHQEPICISFICTVNIHKCV